MKKNNSIFKNIAKVLSANFLVAVVGFAGSFIFPKILSIESYALFHKFTLYVGYIGILHLGFSSGMVVNYAGMDYNKIEKEQYKSEITILSIILIFFTILFGTIWIITKNIMIGYITLAIIPVCIINSYKSLYQAWSQFNKFSKLSIVTSAFVPIIAILYYLIKKELTGHVYIVLYLIIYWIVSMYIFLLEIKNISNVKGNDIISTKNINTEKNGLALVIGNYINTLFISADKQFVSLFYGVNEFAFYSFGISMQSLMTVFITSISQPVFPAIASGKIEEKNYDTIKKMLIIFGSFSGLAYFILSIIVKLYIKKYIASLEVISYYFIVFPAMAVINCLYINLYKIKKMTKKYIITLLSILIVAILLNSFAIIFSDNYVAIALATAATYYIWLIIGSFQFKSLKLDLSDYFYLICYIIVYFIIIKNFNEYIGFVIYLISILLIASTIYNKVIKYLIGKIKTKNTIL